MEILQGESTMSPWDVTVSWRLLSQEVISVFFVYFGQWFAVSAAPGIHQISYRLVLFL